MLRFVSVATPPNDSAVVSGDVTYGRCAQQLYACIRKSLSPLKELHCAWCDQAACSWEVKHLVVVVVVVVAASLAILGVPGTARAAVALHHAPCSRDRCRCLPPSEAVGAAAHHAAMYQALELPRKCTTYRLPPAAAGSSGAASPLQQRIRAASSVGADGGSNGEGRTTAAQDAGRITHTSGPGPGEMPTLTVQQLEVLLR